MPTYQPGFWDVEDRLRELSAQGDPLEKLAATVDFEMFRPELATATARRDPSKGGRPGFDPVLKFRMLVLQAMHGLSLDQTEYLLRDRLSWMRFCGLGPGDAVPDANTLWDFREALIAADALAALPGYDGKPGKIAEAIHQSENFCRQTTSCTAYSLRMSPRLPGNLIPRIKF